MRMSGISRRTESLFQDSHKALLKTGRFMDVQGFDFEASHSLSMAKSFVSGRKTGVVVWNISEDTPLEFKVSVPAMKLVLAQSPEDTALSSTSDGHVLAPQSIAILVFE